MKNTAGINDIRWRGDGEVFKSLTPLLTTRTNKTTDDHIGALTIRNKVVTRIDTPNGYFGAGKMHYYIKDYQGNVRQVTDAAGAVEQDNHYYPYGMLMGESSDILAAAAGSGSTNSNPYLFGSKEYLTTAGANLLDFTARTYDPSIPLFHTPDPLRDKYHSFSAYLYCLGNPILFTDFNGMAPQWWYRYNMNVRLWGLINAVAGLTEAACGAAATSTGVGAVVGIAAMVHGCDVAAAGISQMASGQETSSLTSQAIQAAGVSQETAEFIEAGTSIALTGGAGYFSNSSKVVKAVNASAESSTEAVSATVKTSANSGKRIGWTGEYGEMMLKKIVGGESQVNRNTTLGLRRIDQLVSDQFAREAKTGYTYLTQSIKVQIQKDVELLRTGAIEKCTWHFFRSPETGRVGASKQLLQAL